MRLGLSIVFFLVAVIPCPAQDPPPPAPVLPAARADTAALRAAISVPLDPPEYHFRFDATGRCEVIDRTVEANARIAEISKSLKQDPTDAERLDELRLWHHRRGDLHGIRDCAARAARWYRERLRTDPYHAGLLVRCGEALLESGEFEEAERRLRKAVAVDPHNWRGWYLLGRLQIDSAYALLNVPNPFVQDEIARQTLPMPRPLPAAMQVEMPPAPEVATMLQPVRPVQFSPPVKVASAAEVRQMAVEARGCL